MARTWASPAQRRRVIGAAAGWCLWTLVALAGQAAAGGPGAFYPSGRYGKRVETEGPMLPAGRGGWSVGRAGRSGAPLPRADRFFMGSRYGKRGAGGPALAELTPLTQAQVAAAAAVAAAHAHHDQGPGRAHSAHQSAHPAFVALPDMWALPAITANAPDFASSEELDMARDRAVEATHGGEGRPPVPTSCVYTGIADFYRCSGRDAEHRHAVEAPPSRGPSMAASNNMAAGETAAAAERE